MQIRLLIIIVFLLPLAQGCSPGKANPGEATPASRAQSVTTVAVQQVEYEEEVRATGQLALSEQSQLSFKTGGIIRRMLVEEGQNVQKGQLLATLDLDEVKAQTAQADLGIQQANIQVENAKLALRLAERDYQNAEGLYQDSVATLEQLQNAEVQLENAQNQLQAAKKSLKVRQEQAGVADYNLRFSRILAPADGTILRRMAEPNELVGPGRPVLLFGSQEKAWVVKISVSDKDVVLLDMGDRARITFDAYPEQIFEGRVRTVASMADPMTNTYAVEIALQQPKQPLRSGFIGRVCVLTGSKQSLLEIPINALLVADRRTGSVYLAEEGKARKRRVDIYRIKGDRLLLRSGVEEGELVITSGVGYLQDGDSITTKSY